MKFYLIDKLTIFLMIKYPTWSLIENISWISPIVIFFLMMLSKEIIFFTIIIRAIIPDSLKDYYVIYKENDRIADLQS